MLASYGYRFEPAYHRDTCAYFPPLIRWAKASGNETESDAVRSRIWDGESRDRSGTSDTQFDIVYFASEGYE
jgi:hypothetical protein